MTRKPILVVSDIHLGAVPAATERDFRRFLAWAAETADALLINGDLFDFWFEYRHVILREHFRVAAALADLTEAGVSVTFVGGNHDGWAGSFLRDDLGVRVAEGPVEMVLGNRRALVAHGDGVGRGDLRYRALKRVIRSAAAVRGFRALHPDLGRKVAGLASSTEHKAEGRGANAGRAAFIRAWAREQLAARPELDLVLAGHAHSAALEEVAPGRFYVNSGDWLGTRRTYVRLSPDGPPSLEEWG